MRKNIRLCEWLNLYPLKKISLLMLCMGILWGIYRIGYKVIVVKEILSFNQIIFLLCVFVLFILTVRYTVKFLSEKYKSVPSISKYISKKELQKIINCEEFEHVEVFAESSFYNKLLIGSKWICINNHFISLNAINMLGILIAERGTGSRGTLVDYYLLVTYFNGETVKIYVETKPLTSPICKIECEKNHVFRKLLIETLYKVTGINGVYIGPGFEKEYYVYVDFIKRQAKDKGIKGIYMEDIEKCNQNNIVDIKDMQKMIPAQDLWENMLK